MCCPFLAGTSLLHKAAAAQFEAAALFLCQHGASPNSADRQTRETPLHVAAQNGLAQLCSQLLLSGGDPNARTVAVARQRSMSVTRTDQANTATAAGPSNVSVASASRGGMPPHATSPVQSPTPYMGGRGLQSPPRADSTDGGPRFGLGAVSGWSSDTVYQSDTASASMTAALSNLSQLTAATDEPG